VGWLPAATVAAVRTAREWRPDVVLSSASPITSHLIGLATSRTVGVPWVADFRDPWTLLDRARPLARPLRALNARTERALVRRASRVILADEHWDLVGLRRDDPRRVVITNGADEADFESSAGDHARPPEDRFRLSHIGSLFGGRDPAPVFEAIERLAHMGVLDARRFEVAIIGNVWLAGRTFEPGAVPITVIPYVEHARAVTEMRSATALLFYEPAHRVGAAGKIFEYLVSGRPILSVAPRENVSAQLVAELGAGVTARPDDPAGIERAIAVLYQRWEAGTLGIAPEVRGRALARFSRRALTGELARVLEATVEARSP